LIEHVRYKHR